jgi:phosphoesterase RecJ-like protein
MKVSEDGQMAWVLLPQSLFDDTGTTVEDTEDFINFPRSLAGVEVAFLLRETNEAGIIKASLRANNEVDVARVATQFGGGGHRKAAGFSMKGTLQEVQAATAKAVAKAISEARQRTV